jgi:hypothetical protein
MATTGTTMLMLVARNRSRPLTRPSREIHQNEEGEIDALPGPGVYWDTNVLIRQKVDSWTNCSASEQKHTTALAGHADEQEASNAAADRDEENPARDTTTDYDAQEDTGVSSKGPKSKEYYSETDEESLADANSFLHKQLHVSGNELTDDEDELSDTEEDKALTPTSSDHNHHKYYKENQHYEFHDGNNGWNYYHDNEGSSTPEPSDRGSVNDRNELEESENLYPYTNLRSYIWRTVTTLSNAAIQLLHSGLDITQCYDLLVCEAHRVGRSWGESGLLLASSFR